MSASAETVQMNWKPMDKAYITLIVDDNNEQLEQMYRIVCEEYGFPLCAAVPVKSYDKTVSSSARPESLTLLHKIQDNGGEILSHTLTHKVFNSAVSWETVDYELGESYRRLTAEGFRVNGVILAGGGGSEDTSAEYRTELEAYTSKYYKYSDYYGASTQYYKPRNWIAAGWSSTKRVIDDAINGNQWQVLAWHNFPDVFGTNLTEAQLRKVLDYLKEKQDEGVLEVVTYREVHKKFGNWASPVDLDTIPPKATTTTTTTTTAEDTTTTTLRPTRTGFRTTTTAVAEDTPETTATVTTTAPAAKEKRAPRIPWAIVGGAIAAVAAIGTAVLLVLREKKKQTSPKE